MPGLTAHTQAITSTVSPHTQGILVGLGPAALAESAADSRVFIHNEGCDHLCDLECLKNDGNRVSEDAKRYKQAS